MDELLPLADRPSRRRVPLRVENSKTYTVDEMEVAEFLASLRKTPEKPAKKVTLPTYLDPSPVELYDLPDHAAFVARLEKACEDAALLDYFNANSPYRGLVVYGSNQACAAVAVAEGFVRSAGMKVWVLTPKAGDYRAQMLACSDAYRKAQHWSFASKWATNDKLASNYEALNPKERAGVDKQIEAQINQTYTFVHYNGLNCLNLKETFKGDNPFDNTVVIVDDAHGLAGRISADLGQAESPFSQLYEWLLSAKCRVVALSGTPLIHDPRELGILYNLARGYVPVWRVKLERAATLATLGELSKRVAHFSSTELEMVVACVPPGFAAEYKEGALTRIKRAEEQMTDAEFTEALRKFGDAQMERQKLLPDGSFEGLPRDVFVRRIRGLTAYLKEAQLPDLQPRKEHHIGMSGHQSAVYQKARAKEEGKLCAAVPADFREASRAACNFAYPSSVPRPAESCEEGDKALGALTRANAFADLPKYSPKFAAVLAQLKEETEGRQVVFSNFTKGEGLPFFAEALNAAGYERLVLEPTANSGWDVVSLRPDSPKYVLYAGSDREKEMYVNVFNRNWAAVPDPLHEELKAMDVKLFLVGAGAGVSLLGVTQVHLLDPYWHPGRFEQAVAYARHCSEETPVTPHVYLMKTRDGSASTDMYIYAHSKAKEAESQKWVSAIRESL